MIEIIPNWHPIFVHFTVGLLGISVLLFLASSLMKSGNLQSQWLSVAYWNLWIGTLLTIGTVTMGWLAYNSVTHDTPSHEAMTLHRNWAFGTAGLFAALALWAILFRRKNTKPNIIFIIVVVAALGLLSTTAWLGGEAVYRFGLGVMSMPKPEGEGHSHSHGDGGVDSHGGTDAEGKTGKPAAKGDSHSHDKLATKPKKSTGNGHSHDKPATMPRQTKPSGDDHSHSH